MSVVYVAACSDPTGSLIWHDGITMEQDFANPVTRVNWLELSIGEYHRRVRPHIDADVIVVRVQGPDG